MTTTENNKLIAEFMGLEKREREGKSPTYKHILKKGFVPMEKCAANLEYHSSWDWLMPVVEKIESIVLPESTKDVISFRFSVKIKHQTCIIKDYYTGEKVVHFAGNTNGKIAVVYDAVVAFIKWYNQQKQ